jgi:C-terminal peptidase prc
MRFFRDNGRRLRPAFALAAALGLAACIFENDALVPESRYSSGPLDTLAGSNVVPQRIVHLFQPLRDPALAGKPPAAPRALPPVNVKLYPTGETVQYRLTRQRFGDWTASLEFQWNYFLLQAYFLFPSGLPDTAGLAASTQSLYDHIHKTDRFTNYFDSAAAPGALDRITQTTRPGALGVEVALNDGGDTLFIRRVVPGSPADRAGVVRGMAILAVDDSTVTGDSAMARFSRFSAGDSGKSETLTVLAPLGGIRDITMVRAPVDFPTVYVDSLDGMGYIAVTGFMPETVEGQSSETEFKSALAATRRFPVTVLDLRDNGGGSLDLTLRMCDQILPAGAVIIRQHERRFDEDDGVPLLTQAVHLATSAGSAEKRKFVLLGNGGSASAAEIFIAALREGAGAPFVGMKTYGKGVGQSVRNTPGRGLALVTFLKFMSKDGLDYHGRGIEPDYPDSSRGDRLLVKAVAVGKGLGKTGAKLSARAAEEAAAALEARIAEHARAVEWNRRQGIRMRPLDFGEW